MLSNFRQENYDMALNGQVVCFRLDTNLSEMSDTVLP